MVDRKSPAALGQPLDPQWRQRLATYVRAAGEPATCAALDLSRPTLARALAGLGLRKATAEVLIMRLSAVTSSERPR
jgi:hypothetical protein